MTTETIEIKPVAAMAPTGIIPILVTALFPKHDLSELYPPPKPAKPSTLRDLWCYVQDIAMGLDFIDFLWSVGLMPVTRGLLRAASGSGRPDFGLHVIYLPWTSTAADEHDLRRYGIQVRHICGDSRGYYLAVGSHQAKWAVEVLTRTMTGRRPRSWSERRQAHA